MKQYIFSERVVLKMDGIRWVKLSATAAGHVAGVEVEYKGGRLYQHFAKDEDGRAFFEDIVAELKEREASYQDRAVKRRAER